MGCDNEKITHRHRILPGHEGGEYVEGNVVKVGPTRHAMWHFANWQRTGKEEDRLAWRGLAGISTHEESVLGACSLGGIKGSATHRARGTGLHDPTVRCNPHLINPYHFDQTLGKYIEENPDHQKKAGQRAAVVNKEIKQGLYNPEIRRKGPKALHSKKTADGKSIAAVKNSVALRQKCMDPNHPKLGIMDSGNLAKKQRKLGLPSGPENRVKVL
jgi:hypothetical protein